mgnify:CR=1 FL=1
MRSNLSTLTNISEDDCQSVRMDRNELKPLNRQLVNEDYINKISKFTNEEPFNDSLLYSQTTNFKQLFRYSHLNIFHKYRSLLWYNLMHHNQLRQQHQFQQAIERYPDDVR